MNPNDGMPIAKLVELTLDKEFSTDPYRGKNEKNRLIEVNKALVWRKIE